MTTVKYKKVQCTCFKCKKIIGFTMIDEREEDNEILEICYDCELEKKERDYERHIGGING